MLGLVGRVLDAPKAALRTVTRARADDARAVWTRGEHAQVAVRGVGPERTAEYGQALAARVAALPGVEWAGLDAGAGRLVGGLLSQSRQWHCRRGRRCRRGHGRRGGGGGPRAVPCDGR